ncbi:hypothetical protein J2810_003260 [Chryseobacterium rhizosphaerae]|nr:hypothetical protein [Chryseobacterium rhizosphaerae]
MKTKTKRLQKSIRDIVTDAPYRLIKSIRNFFSNSKNFPKLAACALNTIQ